MAIIETLALILIALGTLKLLALYAAPNEMISLSRSLLSKPKFLQLFCLVLAGVVLYYLLQARITILEILAIMLFCRLLIGASLVTFAQPLLKSFQPRQWMKENKLVVLAFVLLLAWGIKDLFF